MEGGERLINIIIHDENRHFSAAVIVVYEGEDEEDRIEK
jgi:hypothetical protein